MQQENCLTDKNIAKMIYLYELIEILLAIAQPLLGAIARVATSFSAAERGFC
jgi:hypothetical protein